MKQLSFTTTGSYDLAQGFGCASLGLPGVCGNDKKCVVTDPRKLKALELTGTYDEILSAVKKIQEPVQAAIVLFGNVGGENTVLRKLQEILACPIVGGGAAIDFATNSKGLITGRGEAALLLITDERYTYTTETLCIHDQITLSGGNQQKVLLARWLMSQEIKVLIIDEPTRGIDVGAKSEIYALLNQLANEGLAVVVVSSEMQEIINVCDRVYVMKNGKINGEIPRKEVTQTKLMEYAIL